MSADVADEVDELAAYFELAIGKGKLDGANLSAAEMVRGVLGSWNVSGTFRLQRAGFKVIKGVVDRVLADFKLAVSQLQLAQRNHENLQALRNLGLAQVPPKQQELENGQRAWAVIKPPTDPGIIHHLVQHAKATRTTTPLVIPPYDALTLQMKIDALTAKCEAVLAQAELFVKNDENAIAHVLPHEGRALLEAPPINYQQPQHAYLQQPQYNGVQQGVYQQPQPALQPQVYPQVYPPQFGPSSSQAGPSQASGSQYAPVRNADPIAQQWYEVAKQQHHDAASSSSHPNGSGFVQQNAAPSYAPVFNNMAPTPAQASVSNGNGPQATAHAAQMEHFAQQQRQQGLQEQHRLQQQQQQQREQREQQGREARERQEQERRQHERERLLEQQRVQHERERLQELQRQQQLEVQRREQERQREERERLEQQRQKQEQERLLEQQRQGQQLRERLLEEQRRQKQSQAQMQAAGPSGQTVAQLQASTSLTTAPTAQLPEMLSRSAFKESSYSSLSGALGPSPSSSTSQQPSGTANKVTSGTSAATSATYERQALLYQQAYANRHRQFSIKFPKQAQAEISSNRTYPVPIPPLPGTLSAGAPGQPRPGSRSVGHNGVVAGQRIPGPLLGVGANGHGLPYDHVPAFHRFKLVKVGPPKQSVPRPPAAAPAAPTAPLVTPQSARRSTLARDIINALEGASALASVPPVKRKRKRSQAKSATRRPSSPGGTTNEQADIELVTPAVAESRLPQASRVPASTDVDANGGASIEEVDMDVSDAGPVRKEQPLFWSDSSPDPDVQMQGTRSEDDVDNLLGDSGHASASSPDGQNNAAASRARTPRLFPPATLPKPRAPPQGKPTISDLFREVRDGWAHPKPDRLIVELPRLPKDWRPRILEADYGRFSDFSSRLSTRRCHWSDCPAVLDSENHLQLHWDKVHGAAKSYDRDFSCLWDVCDLRPTSFAKLRHHVRCRHVRDGLRCAYEGCDFRGSGEADLSAHIAAEHGTGTLRRLAVPQQVVPVQIIPDLPQGVRPAWSLTTPPVRPAAISRERRDLLGNWVLMRIYATVDYGLITAKSPTHQRGKRKEPAPPPQMEPLVEGFELRAKEQFEWLRPASPDLPRKIPRQLRVGQRPGQPV